MVLLKFNFLIYNQLRIAIAENHDPETQRTTFTLATDCFQEDRQPDSNRGPCDYKARGIRTG